MSTASELNDEVRLPLWAVLLICSVAVIITTIEAGQWWSISQVNSLLSTYISGTDQRLDHVEAESQAARRERDEMKDEVHRIEMRVSKFPSPEPSP